SEPVLPKGSLVLVTGATGFIAGHIILEALQLGYKVRGTVRSKEKANQNEAIFSKLGFGDNYSTVIVEDMAANGAFDEAVKGCDAIIHAASVLTFSPNPEEVIPPVVAGTTGILKAAKKEQKVKRVVYTSSSTAALIPKPNTEFYINKDTWDDEACDIARNAKPPYDPSSGFAIYAASKTEAERAVWKFVKEEKPAFVVNCVLPNANMGRAIPGGSVSSTGSWVPTVYKGGLDSLKDFPPQYYINVTDDARLHVAAAVLEPIEGERVFAFAEPYNWNDIMDAIKKAKPDFKVQHIPQDKDLSKVDTKLAVELLKKWWGQDGFTSLEEGVRQNLEDLD
ncbi:hypothetical protein LTS18_011402, partial [Coniosporium uncinatum]